MEESINHNVIPISRKRHFDFGAFDQMLTEALEDQPAPGEIGGVIATPLFKEWFGDDYDDAA